jgi:hypothetical protein
MTRNTVATTTLEPDGSQCGPPLDDDDDLDDYYLQITNETPFGEILDHIADVLLSRGFTTATVCQVFQDVADRVSAEASDEDKVDRLRMLVSGKTFEEYQRDFDPDRELAHLLKKQRRADAKALRDAEYARQDAEAEVGKVEEEP